MLNKTKIIIAAVSVLITGLGAGTGAYIATRNNDTAASTSSEVISMASSKTASVDTSPIDSAVSAGVEKINEAASKAIQQIESKAGQQSSAPVQSKAESSSPKMTKGELNKSFNSSFGKIIFTRFSSRLDQTGIDLHFTVENEKLLRFTKERCKAIDATGALMEFGAGEDNSRAPNYVLGLMYNAPIPDPSHFTITLAPVAINGTEYDPVTIDIDIPLE